MSLEEKDNAVGMPLLVNTVEGWLNAVSFEEERSYIPSKFAIDFVNFIKMVGAGSVGEEHKTPIVHYKMLDQVPGKTQNIANLCSRGLAKTTIMGEYMFLYIAVYGGIPGFGDVDYALYVSDSMENGVKKMRLRLQRQWENSPFLKKYIPTAKFTDVRWYFKNAAGKEFVVTGHGAKALSLDSRLFTENGRVTIADVKVGDKIFGADGNLATVTKKSEVFHRDMYEIVLEDGRKLKVSDEHINSVVQKKVIDNRPEYVKRDLYTHELIKESLQHVRYNKSDNKVTRENLLFIENCRPLEYKEKAFPLDPYTLGLLLCDGSMKDDKFIPEQYFYGSIEQRLELLRGLIDTNGHICKTTGRIDFCSNSEKLVDDVASLVRSLAGTAKKRKSEDAYKIEIWSEYNPAKLTRKAKLFKNRTKSLVAIKSITHIADEPSQCIAIDNQEHQFIAEDYFRTHNTGVRGTVELGTRPHLAILDDLISDEDARSPTIRASVEDTVNKAIDYALHPKKRKTIWSGTPFNASDPLYRAIESGAWNVNVFPVCESFPVKRSEFKGAWPDRFDYDFVKNQHEKARRGGNLDAFNQELMLRIYSQDSRLIPESQILFCSTKKMLHEKSNYNFYITTDFATTTGTHSDFAVISVWATTPEKEIVYVDGILKKQDLSDSVEDLFEFVEKYKPIQVGIEVSGQQKGFVSYLESEITHRGIGFNIVEVNPTRGEGKFARVLGVQPMFKFKQIKFSSELKDSEMLIEGMSELEMITKEKIVAKHDDFIDTVSQLPYLRLLYPSSEEDMEELSTILGDIPEGAEDDNPYYF